MMKIDIQEKDGGLTVTLVGRLDTPAAAKAQATFKELQENVDKEIILDCRQLEYISSSGLRLFLALRKEAGIKGGRVIIKSINDDIRKVFMMTGFFNLFEIRTS